MVYCGELIVSFARARCRLRGDNVIKLRGRYVRRLTPTQIGSVEKKLM